MTIDLALAQIPIIVAGTTPPTTKMGYGSFRHLEEMPEEGKTPIVDRSFLVELESTSIKGPYTGIARRYWMLVKITLIYSEARAYWEQHRTIARDHAAVAERLLTESLWDSASTGLLAVGSTATDGGTDIVFDADIEPEDGMIFVPMSVPIYVE